MECRGVEVSRCRGYGVSRLWSVWKWGYPGPFPHEIGFWLGAAEPECVHVSDTQTNDSSIGNSETSDEFRRMECPRTTKPEPWKFQGHRHHDSSTHHLLHLQCNTCLSAVHVTTLPSFKHSHKRRHYIYCLPSTVNCQLSTFNSQLSTFNSLQHPKEPRSLPEQRKEQPPQPQQAQQAPPHTSTSAWNPFLPFQRIVRH